MMGWPVALKCPVACLFFELSQQPTLPQAMHIRRCTQSSPLAWHLAHTLVAGSTTLISPSCAQGAGGASLRRGGGTSLEARTETAKIARTMPNETPVGICRNADNRSFAATKASSAASPKCRYRKRETRSPITAYSERNPSRAKIFDV